MLSFLNQSSKNFFRLKKKQKFLDAIRDAEKETSGEIRFYIESKCRFVDPLDRAAEIFLHLKMNETANRNAVLVYIATDHRQLAVVCR